MIEVSACSVESLKYLIKHNNLSNKEEEKKRETLINLLDKKIFIHKKIFLSFLNIYNNNQ